MRQWRPAAVHSGVSPVADARASRYRHVNSFARQLDRGPSTSASSRPPVIRSRHISAPLNNNATTHLFYRRLFDLVIVTGGEREPAGSHSSRRSVSGSCRGVSHRALMWNSFHRPPTHDIRAEFGIRLASPGRDDFLPPGL